MIFGMPDPTCNNGNILYFIFFYIHLYIVLYFLISYSNAFLIYKCFFLFELRSDPDPDSDFSNE